MIYEYQTLYCNLCNGLDDCATWTGHEMRPVDLGELGWRVHSAHHLDDPMHGYGDVLLLERATPESEVV